ncbi:hypothetical protein P691DRAFT_720412 [Macrolepiota fuliginosa MF-IS2]|uniref:Uncharacterized protein n=1 Tax=Macrolepiota fuliginosa MF-IS2 TaxID=1400762 RepID=A0A9P5XNN1_9AGAR|nr:hypothetical protein P691DRAFT_720412 [Macrolepiota fuliginosa MF-IS2]
MLSTTFMRFCTRSIAASTSRRYLHATMPQSTAASLNKGDSASGSVQHTTDSYAKDVDTTPASDHLIHRVDASSEVVQKPYEAPAGEWSRVGVVASEDAAANRTGPRRSEGNASGGKKN